MKNSNSRRLAYFLYSILVFGLCLFVFLAFYFAEKHSGGAGPSSCNMRIVSHVVDGDTLDLKDGTRVRLIGIDTPESIDQRKPVQFFAEEARNKLAALTAGKEVCLKVGDYDTKDKYDRALRYVYVGDTFVNAEMVKEGYAKAYTQFPFRYKDDFLRYQKEARANERGLWNAKAKEAFQEDRKEAKASAEQCGAETVCPEDAKNFYGQKKTVRFYVARGYNSGKAIFLNSSRDYSDLENFTAVIFASSFSYFPDNPVSKYTNKTIEVTGKIKKYQNAPEIVLTNASQIHLVN